MWGQSKITSCCICVWCESGELGGRSSSRFHFVTPAVETSGRVAKHQQQSSSAKAANGLNMLTVPAKKSPTQTSNWIVSADLTGGEYAR